MTKPTRYPASPTLVLASASPRRSDLLRRMGLRFEVDPADIDEDRFHKGVPRLNAPKAALAKARHVAGRHPAALILSADTMVTLGGRVFGKPADAEEAAEMIRALSGATHSVLTGLALVDTAQEREWTEVVETRVTFRAVTEEEIAEYVQTPEPYDKAGGYGIQSRAGEFVTAIEGDYFNVVGLPARRLLDGLARFMDISGLTVPEPPGD